ncbi:unnamed protein product [Linum trigynum]|uniref:Uncharacterized protein n=1 Tax=Linum trigynum TaxID=586398 RepID=A0AAV2FDC7_9ROSI
MPRMAPPVVASNDGEENMGFDSPPDCRMECWPPREDSSETKNVEGSGGSFFTTPSCKVHRYSVWQTAARP